MIRPVIALLCLFSGGICGCGDEAVDPNRPRGAAEQPAAVGMGPVATNQSRELPIERRILGSSRNEPATAMERVPATPPTSTEGPAGPDRDLSAELRALVGDPSSCLPEDTSSLPNELTIRVSATVTASGVVTRKTVSAPGLDAEAIECVERRLSYARFTPPVPNGPTTVSADLLLRRQPSPEGNGEDRPLLQNVR